MVIPALAGWQDLLPVARAGPDLLDLDLGAADLVAHRLGVLLDPLAERDLAHLPRRLAHLGLLGGPGHLDRLVPERRLGLLPAQHAGAPLALGLDVLLAQVHRLLHRPLHHPAGDPHPAGRDPALADRQLLLDHPHALLTPGAPLPAVPAALVAVHDLDRPLDLRLRHLGGDQPLAAAGGRGELARVVPAEAAGDDLAHELVLAALQDHDVPLREAGLDELLDHPAGGLAVERADDGRRHLSVSLCRLVVCCSCEATPGANGPQPGSPSPASAASRRSTTASSRRSVTRSSAWRVAVRRVIRTSSVARRRFSTTTTSSWRVTTVVSPSCRTGTGASTQRSSGSRSTSTVSTARGRSTTSSCRWTRVRTRTAPVTFLRLRTTARSSTTGTVTRWSS